MIEMASQMDRLIFRPFFVFHIISFKSENKHHCDDGEAQECANQQNSWKIAAKPAKLLSSRFYILPEMNVYN